MVPPLCLGLVLGPGSGTGLPSPGVACRVLEPALLWRSLVLRLRLSSTGIATTGIACRELGSASLLLCLAFCLRSGSELPSVGVACRVFVFLTESVLKTDNILSN